ncbi:hypothetical protein ACOMHN_023183 [Nucella lapillus]
MAEDKISTLDQLATTGRDLGYEGEDLRKFVEGQQRIEREERAKKREDEQRRVENERKKSEAENEMEKLKIESENEMEKLRIESGNEMEKLKIESGNEMERLRLREKELELERVKIESEGSEASSSIHERQRTNNAPRPKLPKFVEGSDSIDAYISRFEVFGRSQGWQEEEWAMTLSALLTGKALHIFSTLPPTQQTDFSSLKQALLKGFELTEESFRKKFRSVRLQAGETYSQFGARLEHYFQKWMELSGTQEEFGELKELILKEQVLSVCGPELTIYLREKQPKTTEELLQLAEIHREARADQKLFSKQGSGTGEKGVARRPDEGPSEHIQQAERRPEQRSPGQREIRECFLCHRRGHLARDCRTKVQKAAAMERATDGRVEPSSVKDMRKGKVDVQPGASTEGQSLSGMRDTDPSVSSPVKEGWIGKRRVSVLRDTGCSCGVVRAALIKEEDLTGQVQQCTLIDGTKREFSVAEVLVHTSYFSGNLSAMVMESPIYDLVIGNIPGARDPGGPAQLTAESAAVQTCSDKGEKPVKPLMVSARKGGIEASPEEVRRAQEEDPALEGLWKLAKESLQGARAKQKKYFDRRVKRLDLKEGDKVLLLLPTNHNKILMHWKGPFDIIEKVGHQDYRIDVNGRRKLFHANLLRKYTQREGQPAIVAAVVDGGEGDPEVEGEILTPEFHGEETYRDVSVYEGLCRAKQEEARQLLKQFSQSLTDEPGKTTLETCTVELTTKQPVHAKAYPIPYATRQVVEEEMDKMLKLGVIEPSRSPYCAPVVIVRKKSGEHRFCVDYRRLNNVTKVDAEVIPNIEDLFAQISSKGSKYFTRIDLSIGYWQIALNEESKEVTAFSTPVGLFQWRVLPFGMVNAPAVFTRMMRKLLKGLKGVENFMDDILIASKTWEEHMSQLAEVLMRLKSANLTARPTKCQVGFPDLEFLGFMVGGGAKQPEKSKVEQMISSARPKTTKEVRSLLGLIGFYREFVPNFAAITSPLSDLTKKGQPPVVEWTDAAEQALQTVKERLGAYPILKLPDMSKQFTLRTDASGVGLGAVLLQEHDGQKFPVKYASRKLSKCEQGYATVEAECLAVVWGVQKFQKYLYGNQFIIETDHQPLKFLQEAKLKNSRVLRWAMSLQPYRYHIDYIPGRENVGTDYLSRVM